jgi:hypothetical protein
VTMSSDRSHRSNEPTGEAESLVGRIDPKSMGSRAFKSGLDMEQKRVKADKEREKRREKEESKLANGGAAKKVVGGGTRYGDVLEATQDCEFAFLPCLHVPQAFFCRRPSYVTHTKPILFFEMNNSGRTILPTSDVGNATNLRTHAILDSFSLR